MKQAKNNIRSSQKFKKKSSFDAEYAMDPKPITTSSHYQGSKKLENKVAVITGGDSGIGKAVAIAFAKEGADCVISYLKQEQDAKDTQHQIESLGRKCLLVPGDITEPKYCRYVVEETINHFKKIDILINNAAEQHPLANFENITLKQIKKTFQTNIFSYFYLTKYALTELKKGAVIINTTSVVAYKGNPNLIDYAATKGAIVSFTRSLALALTEREIRVNGVAPGPIWTPLVSSTFSDEKIAHFGEDVPMGRAGQPFEIAPCYVFLASDDSLYMSGQVVHPNGGIIVNG